MKGQANPVVRIVHEESGQWIYCLRIRGKSFQPKVFEQGKYRIEVGEGESRQVFEGVLATSMVENGVLDGEM